MCPPLATCQGERLQEVSEKVSLLRLQLQLLLLILPLFVLLLSVTQKANILFQKSVCGFILWDVHLCNLSFFHLAGGGTNTQRAVPVRLPLLAPCLSPRRRATGGPAPEGDAAGPGPAPGPGPPPDLDRRLPTITSTSGETFTSQLKMQV